MTAKRLTAGRHPASSDVLDDVAPAPCVEVMTWRPDEHLITGMQLALRSVAAANS